MAKCCWLCGVQGAPGHIKGQNRQFLINDIRDYFGEQVALYFAFISMYTRWLVFPGLVGILVYCTQTDKEKAGQKSLLAFCIMLMVWTGAFIKAWTRQDNALSYDWDSVEGALDKAAPRPQFNSLNLES